MPMYEYTCPECGAHFELLRSLNDAEAEAVCTRCGAEHATRTLSLFATMSKGVGSDRPDLSLPVSGGCCGGSCACKN